MTRLIGNLVLSAIIVFSTGHAGAGDAEAGKRKAISCVACHGEDGNSVLPEWPKLAGQHQSYVVAQLNAFKLGTREDPNMTPIASEMSASDMEDLGAFFAGLKVKTGEADAELVAPGARLYRGGNADTEVPACMACHGPNGAGNPAALYPALAGQHAAYTEKQLRAYRGGIRTTDQNEVMRTIAARLTDEEIKAVSSYIVGLH